MFPLLGCLLFIYINLFTHEHYKLFKLLALNYERAIISFIVLDYSMNNLISSSTVPMPAIPNVSTNTFATLGERNAGSVGPR